MRTMGLSRRRFVLSSAAIGVGGLTVSTRSAWAFSEMPMDVKTEALAFGACQAPGTPNAYHLQLLANIMATLQGKPQTEIEARLASATCPLCGCPVG